MGGGTGEGRAAEPFARGTWRVVTGFPFAREPRVPAAPAVRVTSGQPSRRKCKGSEKRVSGPGDLPPLNPRDSRVCNACRAPRAPGPRDSCPSRGARSPLSFFAVQRERRERRLFGVRLPARVHEVMRKREKEKGRGEESIKLD